MVKYSKKSNKGRKGYKKPRVSKPVISAVRREVKKIINKNSETKCKWTQPDEVSLSTLTQFYAYDPLLITQGLQPDNRVGNEIRLQGHHLRYMFQSNANTNTWVRIALVKTYDETQLTSASYIFEDANGAQLRPQDIPGLNMIYHPFDKQRINVLFNKVFKLGNPLGYDAKDIVNFTRFTKLHNMKIEFEGNNTGSQNVKPRLHILIMVADANDDTSLGNTVEVSGVGRLWYKDL